MKRPFRPKTETSYHNAVLFLDRFLVGVEQVCHCFGVFAEAVLLTLRIRNLLTVPFGVSGMAQDR